MKGKRRIRREALLRYPGLRRGWSTGDVQDAFYLPMGNSAKDSFILEVFCPPHYVEVFHAADIIQMFCPRRFHLFQYRRPECSENRPGRLYLQVNTWGAQNIWMVPCASEIISVPNPDYSLGARPPRVETSHDTLRKTDNTSVLPSATNQIFLTAFSFARMRRVPAQHTSNDPWL